MESPRLSSTHVGLSWQMRERQSSGSVSRDRPPDGRIHRFLVHENIWRENMVEEGPRISHSSSTFWRLKRKLLGTDLGGWEFLEVGGLRPKPSDSLDLAILWSTLERLKLSRQLENRPIGLLLGSH